MPVLKYTFDTNKSVVLIKYILQKFDSLKCDFHRLFKILYFAEQKHLVTYGRGITGDRYIAMKDGPVPSNIYDLLKVLRGDSVFAASQDLTNDFTIIGSYDIQLLRPEINLDIIAESELECLNSSIEENRSLTFIELSSKSHDNAWTAAGRDNSIKLIEIAKAGGANDDFLKYIESIGENKYKLSINSI